VGARILGVATVVLMALGSALTGTAVARGALTLTIDYSGVYNFTNTTSYHGTASGTVDQAFSWTWHAQGEADPENGDLTVLPGHLQVVGTLDESFDGRLGVTGSTHCTYDAGSHASAPIYASEHLAEVMYGIDIPGAVSTCNGQRGGDSDPLACDFNSCATICAEPPALSTADKFTPAVLTAFKPTTDYMRDGAVFLGEGYGGFGTVTTTYDLPPETGQFTGADCGNAVAESGAMTIFSQVTASILDTRDGFSVNFPDGKWPDHVRPIDILDSPGGPYAPNIIVPPHSDEPPEVTLPRPAVDSSPVVGVIEIRCPRRDRRCAGTVSVTGPAGSPRHLGAHSYSVTGGREALVSVALAARVRAALQRTGSVTVRVRVNSVTTPGNRHFHARRAVKLIEYKPVPGAPAG
jgi:hypothetical protein